MSATGSGVLTLAVVLLMVAAALVSPAGRRAATTALGSVGRWPALIRAEMRGNAPLSADDSRDDTRPDIPAVADEPLPPTRGLPQVGHPHR